MNKRFTDLNKRLVDFEQEVWVTCPQCDKQALAQVHIAVQQARLFCGHCGYNKQKSIRIPITSKMHGVMKLPAHAYFDASLWFLAPFKQEVFWAYNLEHLRYLEAYIGASLRVHKERSHFTLLEKLPKFYHEAKNRDALLKLIENLKLKN